MKKLIFIWSMLAILLFTACDPQWDVNVDVEVNNSSSKTILVFFCVDPNRLTIDTIIEITPNTIHNRVMSFKSISFGNPSPGPLEFIIYNKLDSTSVSLKRSEDGLYKEFIDETTLAENGNIFGGLSKADLKISLNITDSLLSKMSKNTLSTDSIFELKK